jgi:hypothetical protein
MKVGVKFIMSLSRCSSQVQPYRYVKVTINAEEIDLINIDNNVVFHGMDTDVTIHRSDDVIKSMKLLDLDHETKNFFDRVNEEYRIEFYFCHNKVTTTLPNEISSNLIKFLKLYRPNPNGNYCCINFAYEMTYGRGNIKYDNDTSYFNELSSSEFSENKLVPGDIVHLYNAKEPITKFHYAIYIGQSYYLSLFGITGHLIITPLEEVKRGFNADTCVQAVKNPAYDKNRLFKTNASLPITPPISNEISSSQPRCIFL